MRTREFNRLKVGSKVTLVLGRKSDADNYGWNPSWEEGWIVRDELHLGKKEIKGEVTEVCKFNQTVRVEFAEGNYYTCKEFLK